ncbi:MAG: hypothetical protein HQL31_00685 [Planctomycetes bacterium]|nr:hypothetical protein [Planctomycetota bacterium]
MGKDIQHLIDRIEVTVKSHQLGTPGAYCRWLWQDSKESRNLGLNEYGCADAANILYTINRFPSDPVERASWVDVLRSLQNSSSGMYEEPTHFAIHCTAHCIAALELFDVRPLHSLKELAPLKEKNALHRFLDKLEWRTSPWVNSHKGAGIYAALVLAGDADREWQDAYFDWLWEEADPKTGFWRRGCIDSSDSSHIFTHLAGSFHYLFNHEYARRPLRYPERMVDSCLQILHEDTVHLCKGILFSDIDWVYCLSRSLRQCGYRFAECRRALIDMADRYVALLEKIDPDTHDGWNDLHCLFGALCALAELQAVLPGELITDRPLRLVLDRRPFI